MSEFRINTWADLPPAIVAAEQAGAIGLAHLLRGLSAGRIIVHAAGAEIGQYEGAIVAAQHVKRLLLVECSTVTAPAWVALIRHQTKPAPITLLWPQHGVHPVVPPGTVLQ